MSEIKTWDTVFFLKDVNESIGIRIYYFVDAEGKTINYLDKTKEFGNLYSVHLNNPSKGHTTTITYEFMVVVSMPYLNNKKRCVDIKVDVFKKVATKSPMGEMVNTTAVQDDNKHWITECIDLTK